MENMQEYYVSKRAAALERAFLDMEGHSLDNEVESAYQYLTQMNCERESERKKGATVGDSTTIARLRKVLEELVSREIENRVEESRKCNPYFPKLLSISETIKMFSLNRLQSKAFALAAEAFLSKLATAYPELDEEKSCTKPFTMYVGGEAGTGKTRVIEALKRFCRSWELPRSIRTAAPPGIPAALVHGQTVHSLLGLCAGKSFNAKKKLSRKLIEEHAGTLMIIIDEISMLSRKLLGAVDAFFRQVKECDLPFGGVAVLFCGDFFQIPPVASDPVYADPKNSSRKTGLMDFLGYEAWQNLDNVVILEESMRHQDDEVFSQCLRRVRKGETTSEDPRLLNSRVIGPSIEKELQTFGGKDVPLVVRNNELRMALNWRRVAELSRTSGVKPIVCVANLESGRGKDPTFRDLEVLFNTNDTDTSNLPILLPLITGMPVRITQNISVDIGVANDTDGILVGMEFPSDNTFEDARFFNIECVLSSELPQVVYVRSELFKNSLPERFPRLPKKYSDDTIPIKPLIKEGVTKRVAEKLETNERVSIRHCPFVPAFSSTTYKVQGKTVDAIVAFPFLKGCKGAPPFAYLYVVLSRVRKLSSLFLTEPISPEHLHYFKPPKDLVEEESRLRHIHEITIMER